LGEGYACIEASETLALPGIRDCPNTVNDYEFVAQTERKERMR
jgi:hypothetical protein